MMVMTAKVNMKKVMMALAAVAAVILALSLLLDGNKEAKPETSQTTGASQPATRASDARRSTMARLDVPRRAWRMHRGAPDAFRTPQTRRP